ncbi:MAG: dienelactone hydrolase family protein [Gemmobacter sp.]|jgi:carboxymethylenebutenolidase|nr:dienelactone hydrolase family protein [Gemmobacter sp.]
MVLQLDGGRSGLFDLYVADGSDDRLAVVVLQEWWGLNDQIRDVCDRLAAEGFTAAAPDLYRGKVALDVAEAEHLSEGLDWDTACDEQIAATVRHLGSRYAKVAVMGFCMGGALAVFAGIRLAGVDGVVAYYGLPPEDAADPTDMRARFLGHFGIHDDWITPAVADAFMKRLSDASPQASAYSYDADHAFANEEGGAYSMADAELAWERTIRFLHEIA